MLGASISPSRRIRAESEHQVLLSQFSLAQLSNISPHLPLFSLSLKVSPLRYDLINLSLLSLQA